MHRAVLTQEDEIKVMPGYLYHMGVLACDPVESGCRCRTEIRRASQECLLEDEPLPEAPPVSLPGSQEICTFRSASYILKRHQEFFTLVMGLNNSTIQCRRKLKVTEPA